MDQKICVFTGSTLGIGEAIAEHGVCVVVSGRNESSGQRIVVWIRSAGDIAVLICCDVSEDAEAKALIDVTDDRLAVWACWSTTWLWSNCHRKYRIGRYV